MKKIQEKIELIEKRLVLNEKFETQKIFLNEMKKIGIEKLPYSYTALKKFIDSETMDVHYNKHYKGYVNKLNDALSKKDYGDLELEQIIKSISRFNKTIRNNAGGAFNHALFWKMLSPEKQNPSKEMMSLINKNFKTFNNFKNKFEEVAKERFGSGWVWLVLTNKNNLKILSTPNQDNPLMNVVEKGGYPLLGLDLWEHAYYLKYRNKRDEYIKNFWNSINWEFVDKLYKMKLKNKIEESKFLKSIITEGKSQTCNYETVNAIRFIFNVNPKVKNIFREEIDKILAEVFKEHYYGMGEYRKGELSGIYDFEREGRSVINKLNTNYNCFCVLLQDVNKVLRSEGKPEIKLIGLPPFEQISETKKFVKILNDYKFRIFSKTSSTFQNIMSILDKKNTLGEEIENKAIEILRKKFGFKNVKKIGELGSSEDMLKGIDCVIQINGQNKTAQIKPYKNMKENENTYTMEQTGQVKKYTTDLLVFLNVKNELLVFENNKTSIIDGNYTFPKNSLIYRLT
jgi:Fe-Mn family superoxide dismutase